MVEHSWRQTALACAIGVFVFLPSPRAMAIERDAADKERATGLLADSLSRLEAGVTASDIAATEPDPSGAVRTILRRAIADCEELASMLRLGATREETQAVYRRLQRHRQAHQVYQPNRFDVGSAAQGFQSRVERR